MFTYIVKTVGQVGVGTYQLLIGSGTGVVYYFYPPTSGYPLDNPTLPTGIQVFNPTFASGSPNPNAPIIGNYIKRAFTNDSISYAGLLPSGTRLDIYGQTTSGNATSGVTTEVFYDSKGIKTSIIPSNQPSNSLYAIAPYSPIYGYGPTQILNRAEVWRVQTYSVGNSNGYVGGTGIVFGNNLDDGSGGSLAYWQPNTGSGQWLTVTFASKGRVEFTIPNTSLGSGKVWVHNKRGGLYGWSETGADMTITTASAISRNYSGLTTAIPNTHANESGYDIKPDIASAITGLGNSFSPPGEVTLPAGHWYFGSTLTAVGGFSKPIKIRGADLVSGNDLSSSNGTNSSAVVSSASHSFDSTDVNAMIVVVDGNGFLLGTPRQIVSVGSGNATLNGAIGSQDSISGGKWSLYKTVFHRKSGFSGDRLIHFSSSPGAIQNIFFDYSEATPTVIDGCVIGGQPAEVTDCCFYVPIENNYPYNWVAQVSSTNLIKNLIVIGTGLSGPRNDSLTTNCYFYGVATSQSAINSYSSQNYAVINNVFNQLDYTNDAKRSVRAVVIDTNGGRSSNIYLGSNRTINIYPQYNYGDSEHFLIDGGLGSFYNYASNQSTSGILAMPASGFNTYNTSASNLVSTNGTSSSALISSASTTFSSGQLIYLVSGTNWTSNIARKVVGTSGGSGVLNGNLGSVDALSGGVFKVINNYLNLRLASVVGGKGVGQVANIITSNASGSDFLYGLDRAWRVVPDTTSRIFLTAQQEKMCIELNNFGSNGNIGNNQNNTAVHCFNGGFETYIYDNTGTGLASFATHWANSKDVVGNNTNLPSFFNIYENNSGVGQDTFRLENSVNSAPISGQEFNQIGDTFRKNRMTVTRYGIWNRTNGLGHYVLDGNIISGCGTGISEDSGGSGGNDIIINNTFYGTNAAASKRVRTVGTAANKVFSPGSAIQMTGFQG